MLLPQSTIILLLSSAVYTIAAPVVTTPPAAPCLDALGCWSASNDLVSKLQLPQYQGTPRGTPIMPPRRKYPPYARYTTPKHRPGWKRPSAQLPKPKEQKCPKGAKCAPAYKPIATIVKPTVPQDANTVRTQVCPNGGKCEQTNSPYRKPEVKPKPMPKPKGDGIMRTQVCPQTGPCI